MTMSLNFLEGFPGSLPEKNFDFMLDSMLTAKTCFAGLSIAPFVSVRGVVGNGGKFMTIQKTASERMDQRRSCQPRCAP
jgi:hypothetical protein